MSDTGNFTNFGKFVPGFDFLQGLAKQAAGGVTQNIPQLPNLGNWVAPTLNVEELDKRIEELKAVQFWLDQNALALKATIQALEVQKMTLATLKGMNFNMGDVANAFKLKVADSVAGGVQKVADKAKTFSGLEVPPAGAARKAAANSRLKKGKGGKTGAAGVVDPMQWWGALTQQFQAIATDAMKDAAKKTALDTTRNLATGLTKDAVKTATGLATDMAKGMAGSAGRTVAGGARAVNSALRGGSSWPMPPAPAPAAAPAAPAKAARKPAARKPAAKKAKAPARKAARKTSR